MSSPSYQKTTSIIIFTANKTRLQIILNKYAIKINLTLFVCTVAKKTINKLIKFKVNLKILFVNIDLKCIVERLLEIAQKVSFHLSLNCKIQ